MRERNFDDSHVKWKEISSFTVICACIIQMSALHKNGLPKMEPACEGPLHGCDARQPGDSKDQPALKSQQIE